MVSADTTSEQRQVQLDFFPKGPPGESTCYIVGKHLTRLIEMILHDIDEFSLKINLKEKTLNQLYSLIVCVEGKIKPYTEKILKSVVYKMILDEEPTIAQRTEKIA
jgi:hypothetical protein